MDTFEEQNQQLINFLIEQGVLNDPCIINAFKRAPRHLFVTEGYLYMAYQDTPLPLTKGATISQPAAVATMLEHLSLHGAEHVLEIGTGSGWNAALLACCIGDRGDVTTLEIDRDLAKFAKENLAKVKLKNVTVIRKDGSKGHKDSAPYDRIVYTAATKSVPDAVLAQLKVGGILLAPIGGENEIQVLTKMEKISESELVKSQLGYFQFVPLRRSAG